MARLGWTKFKLLFRHFRLHLVIVTLVGIVVIYFQIDSMKTFLLTAFFTLLLPVIDKEREIDRQLTLVETRERRFDRSDRETESTSKLRTSWNLSRSRLPLSIGGLLALFLL